MHVDVGDIDLTSLVHVPAVSVQSDAPSDNLWNVDRDLRRLSHATGPPLLGGMVAAEVLGNQMRRRGVRYFLVWLHWVHRRFGGG